MRRPLWVALARQSIERGPLGPQLSIGFIYVFVTLALAWAAGATPLARAAGNGVDTNRPYIIYGQAGRGRTCAHLRKCVLLKTCAERRS